MALPQTACNLIFIHDAIKLQQNGKEGKTRAPGYIVAQIWKRDFNENRFVGLAITSGRYSVHGRSVVISLEIVTGEMDNWSTESGITGGVVKVMM